MLAYAVFSVQGSVNYKQGEKKQILNIMRASTLPFGKKLKIFVCFDGGINHEW